MTTWRDRYQEASWRGLPFYVETHELAGGRRIITHEFPGRDDPAQEDLGRRAEAFTVEAFILGSDYFPLRNSLLAACRAGGSGTLVHPYLGTMTVVLKDWKLRESKRDGGVAVFTLTFLEATTTTPQEVKDRAAETLEDVAAAETASQGALEDTLDVDSGWIGEKALEAVSAAYEYVSGVVQGARGLWGSTVGAWLDAIRSADAALAGLLGDATGLAADIYETLTGLDEIIPSSQTADAIDVILGFYDFDDEADTALPGIPSTTTARGIEAGNRAAIVSSVQRIALTEAAKLATTADFSSYEEAAGVRDRMTEKFDEAITTAGNAGEDEVYSALKQLKASIVLMLRDKGATLAHETEFEILGTMSALSLAYGLYEDVGREAEIVDRNSAIHHPGFLPGGETLRVLSE